MSLRVKRFDPTSIKESRIIYMIGKRHTGKSCLMRDLLSKMPRPDYVLAMAPTEDTLKMFREFLPEGCIFDHFSQEKLERTLSLQRELISRGKKRTVLIILDDCLYQTGVLKSTAMKNLHFNGRHLRVGMICAAQYLMSLPPEMRTNVDYLFVLRENVLTNRQKLWRCFFGQYDKFELFDKVMTACTQNYGCLCMDGTVSSTDHSDTVMWYRADVHVPPFRLCKQIYWDMAVKYGRSEEEMRRAQARQFEIEAAAVEAVAATSGPTPSGGAGGAGGAGGSKVVVVQTEDQYGNITSSTV